MTFLIQPSEFIHVLSKFKAGRAQSDLVWMDASKYNEVFFYDKKDRIAVKTDVIAPGRVRIPKSYIRQLIKNLNLDQLVEIDTDDPFLLVKQGTFLLKFDYQTEWLKAEQKHLKREHMFLAKQLADVEKKLKRLR